MEKSGRADLSDQSTITSINEKVLNKFTNDIAFIFIFGTERSTKPI